MEQNDMEEDWVMQQTAYLDPPSGWSPDAGAALTRFRARSRNTRQRAAWLGWPAWVTIAALTLGLLALLPATRAKAQQLWQLLSVGKIAFIRVNPWPDDVRSPKVELIGMIIPPIPSRDLEQARWRVQYDPRLPRPGVLSDSPRLSTTFSVSAGTVVHTADLELALKKTGVTDATVPPQWEGAQLAMHTSNIVIAEWPDLVLVQSLPLTMTVPPGFDFSAFSALILRILGVAPDEAKRLASSAGTAPLWLAPIDRDFETNGSLEEIQLPSAPATLLQQRAADGSVKRTTITWSVPDRVFVLTGSLSRELMIATANAVP